MIGFIGGEKEIECGESCDDFTYTWFWKPSDYNGWGFDCDSRDEVGYEKVVLTFCRALTNITSRFLKIVDQIFFTK